MNDIELRLSIIQMIRVFDTKMLDRAFEWIKEAPQDFELRMRCLEIGSIHYEDVYEWVKKGSSMPVKLSDKLYGTITTSST